MKRLLMLAVLICSVGLSGNKAQIMSSRSQEDMNKDIAKTTGVINHLLAESGRAFIEGLLDYSNNDHRAAGNKFNKSVEIFLYSTLNIHRELRLQTCYNQLIETIYRIEFPFKTQHPQLRELSITCSWKIDDVLIENVTKQVALKASQQYALTDEQAKLYVSQQEKKKDALEVSRIELDTARTKLFEVLSRIDGDSKNEIELENAKAVYYKAFDKYYYTKGALYGAYGGQSPLPPEAKNPSSVGFTGQTFEPSPLDELAKDVELDKPKKSDPKEISAQKRIYTRIVKARSGDTVQRLAEREKADPIEVAKYNGLLPNSVLAAGREIKLPLSGNDFVGKAPAPILGELPETFGDSGKDETKVERKAIAKAKPAGPKPLQDRNGRYVIVMNYFNEHLHDPYSMRILRWSPLTSVIFLGDTHWRVAVKYRAKNRLAAYILSERVFYIRNKRIVSTFELD